MTWLWARVLPLVSQHPVCNGVATESTKRLMFRRKNTGLGTDQRKWKSAAQWLRYRRNAVKQAVENQKKNPSPSRSKASISKMARKMWSEGHSKEKQFNVEKEHTRRPLKVIGMALYFRGFKPLVFQLCILISQN